MNVNDLIASERQERVYHCEGECPFCGNTEFELDGDICEVYAPDETGKFVDALAFEYICLNCGARFTERRKIGDYIGTYDVEPGDPD